MDAQQSSSLRMPRLFYPHRRRGRPIVAEHEISVGSAGKDRALQAKVKMAMIYPSIVLTMTFVITVGLAWFVLPQLVGVLLAQCQVATGDRYHYQHCKLLPCAWYLLFLCLSPLCSFL